jgi:hypothetical protein
VTILDVENRRPDRAAGARPSFDIVYGVIYDEAGEDATHSAGFVPGNPQSGANKILRPCAQAAMA